MPELKHYILERYFTKLLHNGTLTQAEFDKASALLQKKLRANKSKNNILKTA